MQVTLPTWRSAASPRPPRRSAASAAAVVLGAALFWSAVLAAALMRTQVALTADGRAHELAASTLASACM